MAREIRVVEDPGVWIGPLRIMRRVDGRIIVVDWEACGIHTEPLAVGGPRGSVEAATAWAKEWLAQRQVDATKGMTPARNNPDEGHLATEQTEQTEQNSAERKERKKEKHD